MVGVVTAEGPAVNGTVAAGFAPVAAYLAELVAADPAYSAQFCAYANGRPVVDLWAGPDADQETVQAVFSATKGMSAVCIALLVQREALDLDCPVSRYWPEFAAAGKGRMTVRVALSHRGGLAGVEPQVPVEDLIDHDALANRVAAQMPHWHPGSAHGYHGLVIGTLMDELVRRVDGRTLAQFFRDEVGEPCGIDAHIAVPGAVEPRVRDVLPQQPTVEQLATSPPCPPGWSKGDSLAGMAFNSAVGDVFNPPLGNIPAIRAAGVAAVGGVASAHGLARLYALCTDGVDGAPGLLTQKTIAVMTQLQSVGVDLVLGMPTRYAIVFQKADERLTYGSHLAFGHDGAGGAIGVADPWYRLAYGYVPRRMSYPGGADERGLQLASQVRHCLRALS